LHGVALRGHTLVVLAPFDQGLGVSHRRTHEAGHAVVEHRLVLRGSLNPRGICGNKRERLCEFIIEI